MIEQLTRRRLLVGIGLLTAGCALPSPGAITTFRSDRISVIAQGTGPDVVLIPGLGSSPQVWQGMASALPGHRLHFVHVNGFAGRAAGANADGPLIAPIADEIARYIREARLERPAVIGHSLGGTIALSLATRHELVSRLMVVDMLPYLGILFAPAGAPGDAVQKVANALRDQSLAASAEARRATVEQGIATMIKSEHWRVNAVRDSLASDQAVTARALHELILTDLRPQLPRIRIPTTILYVKTPNVPLDEAQFDAVYRMSYAGLPGARMRRITDSYHFIMYDQPQRFAEEVRAFVK